MAKYSVFGLLLRIIAAAIILPAASVLHNAACVAQEKPPLARIAEMVVRKGYRDVTLGKSCDRFRLAGSIGDGKCKGYQVNDDNVDDKDGTRQEKYGWLKGWTPSFNTFVERGTSKVRILLANHDGKQGYVFLTNGDGELQNAVFITWINDDWSYSPVAPITPDLRAQFEFEKSAWIKAEQEIADLPDRKD
jgi:hypothetical protein